MHVRVFKDVSAHKEKEIPMLTNRTYRFQTYAAKPTALWSSVGMPGVSSSVSCSGSIPAITSVGGVLKQGHEDLNSLQANSDIRQLQM